jgi:sn-glycerol 3-phosphate transport system substrate-binding protein
MLRKLALGTLFFCAASSAQSTEDVRFWHALNGPQAAAIQRLAARFNASQKDYRVRPVYKGGLEVTFALALAARHGKGAPHIVQIHESLTDDLIAEHLVVPLWQAMADARQRFDAALFPAVSSAFSDEHGRLLALPFASATPVLYYNRDALRRAKLSPAGPPATWYEMPAALGALLDAGSSCPFTSAWPAWVLLENMSAWHNQEFLTQDNGYEGSGTQLVFNGRLMVRWIAMLSSWRKSGYFVYSGRGGDEAEARFAAGECALLTASSASYPALRAKANFDLGVAALPYYDDFDDAPQNTLAGGAALWVLAGKPKRANRGAARFLAFLARPEVQAEWQRMTGFVPLTLAGYELAQKRGYYLKQPGNEVAVRQLVGKIPTGDSKEIRFGERFRIRGIIDEELEAVWSGTKAPLEALNAAVARGNLLLSSTPKR